MPGSQDPSLWQTFLDSRFVHALMTALGVAFASGAIVIGWLRKQNPETKADRELKEGLENGIPKILLEQVAAELHGIREDVGDLRERVGAIEGYLKGLKELK